MLGQFNIGTFYFNGSGVERDTARAAEYFRQAAEQGMTKPSCGLHNSILRARE
jgi:TPR repeat protein